MKLAIGLLSVLTMSGGAVWGQVTITVLSGGAELPTATGYDFGKVAQGDTLDVTFFVHNSTNVPFTVTNANVSGFGFTVSRPSLPYVIAPLDKMSIVVRFTAGSPGSYSAGLQINSTSLTL